MNSAAPAARADRGGLSSLLGSVSLQAFLVDAWQRSAFVGCIRGDADLPAFADVEGLAATVLQIDPERVLICHEGCAIPVSRLCARQDWGSAVARAYTSGHTVLLVGLEDIHSGIRHLCREIEEELFHAEVLTAEGVRANLYLSPERSTGFAPHYDHEDVFVVQLDGEKTWRLHLRGPDLPTRRMASPLDAPPPLERELELRAGQSLYIPRGQIHAAEARRVRSLHLTFSLRTKTLLDVLVRTLEGIGDLRQASPTTTNNGAALALALERALSRVDIGPEALAQAWRSLQAEQSARRRVPGLDHLPGPTRCVEADTDVAHRPGAMICVQSTNAEVALVGAGERLKASPGLEAALRFVAETPRFCPRRLPGLSADEQVQLVRELVRIGMLILS
jgi:mannose-6-phosphate isomerase-like protein (cupin superfamily)